MKLVYATALGRKKSGHSRQRQTLKSTSDHAPREQTARRFDWCCERLPSALRVGQFPPVGEHLKLRPRILRATESPECPPLVEIAKVDRLNPKTLVISYTDGTTCTYSVEQLRSLEPIRSSPHRPKLERIRN